MSSGQCQCLSCSKRAGLFVNGGDYGGWAAISLMKKQGTIQAVVLAVLSINVENSVRFIRVSDPSYRHVNIVGHTEREAIWSCVTGDGNTAGAMASLWSIPSPGHGEMLGLVGLGRPRSATKRNRRVPGLSKVEELSVMTCYDLTAQKRVAWQTNCRRASRWTIASSS